MPDNQTVPKSLIEQIYDELIKRLQGKEGFDPGLVERIRLLAGNGELKSHTKVRTALRP